MACWSLNIFAFPRRSCRELGIFLSARQIWAPALLTAVLNGCSVSFPISPLLVPGSKDDVSVGTAARPLASVFDVDDWRKAKVALSAALDPKGDGSLVGWDNPASGNKGSFAPVGKAYASDAKICRVFVAEVHRKGDERSLEGTACATREGEWSISEAKPANKI